MWVHPDGLVASGPLVVRLGRLGARVAKEARSGPKCFNHLGTSRAPALHYWLRPARRT